jgi:hypothetical protein
MQSVGAKVVFIEVNNTDQKFLDQTYRATVRNSFDYTGLDPRESVRNPH